MEGTLRSVLSRALAGFVLQTLYRVSFSPKLSLMNLAFCDYQAIVLVLLIYLPKEPSAQPVRRYISAWFPIPALAILPSYLAHVSNFSPLAPTTDNSQARVLNWTAQDVLPQCASLSPSYQIVSIDDTIDQFMNERV